MKILLQKLLIKLYFVNFKIYPYLWLSVFSLALIKVFFLVSILEINNIKIKPRDFTAKVMDQWIIKPGTKIDDLEYLRVELIGNKKLILDCFAKTNKKYNIPAGSYNTGIPPSIISQFIINGKIKFKGVHAPEFIVPEIEFFKELKKRNIYVFLNNKKVI